MITDEGATGVELEPEPELVVDVVRRSTGPEIDDVGVVDEQFVQPVELVEIVEPHVEQPLTGVP